MDPETVALAERVAAETRRHFDVVADELRAEWLRQRGESDERLRRTVRVLESPRR
jgi:hypothetical protein